MVAFEQFERGVHVRYRPADLGDRTQAWTLLGPVERAVRDQLEDVAFRVAEVPHTTLLVLGIVVRGRDVGPVRQPRDDRVGVDLGDVERDVLDARFGVPPEGELVLADAQRNDVVGRTDEFQAEQPGVESGETGRVPGAEFDGDDPHVRDNVRPAPPLPRHTWNRMSERLADYRAKRTDRTPEPTGREDIAPAAELRFVVHEHHASHLHWDLRLEHDGVLASFALPRGIPFHPREDRLAVQTEDHPLAYLEFHGEIPAGEYGAGAMTIWDRGTYVVEKWRADELILVFAGERLVGRHVLIRTRERDFLLHRMDPPTDAGREPFPEGIEPMLAKAGALPRDDAAHAYEVKWDGIRAICEIVGGHVRLRSRGGHDVTATFPELRALGPTLGMHQCVLDGEIVAPDATGRPSFQLLQRRLNVTSSVATRLSRTQPVVLQIFDLLFLDGRSTTALPYRDRRRLLEGLELAGPCWRTPAAHVGDGAALLAATRDQGLEGIVAKRLSSSYEPGRRSSSWTKIKHEDRVAAIVGGYTDGDGVRAGSFGALVLGEWDEDEQLRCIGKVGSGFADGDLARIRSLLDGRATGTNPFAGGSVPRGTRFVEPGIVVEVAFRERTSAGTLRHPVFQRLVEGG